MTFDEPKSSNKNPGTQNGGHNPWIPTTHSPGFTHQLRSLQHLDAHQFQGKGAERQMEPECKVVDCYLEEKKPWAPGPLVVWGMCWGLYIYINTTGYLWYIGKSI